ncbi:MAG: hypothetical protein IPM24_12755 [Bryobacterales bacterium]|nr:hypothetical protein [Bryobacterales bacterium]
MSPKKPHTQLTALAILPDRELARQFLGTLPATRAFQLLAEMKAYPSPQAAEVRVRQLRPDLVFIDLATDLDKAAELVEFLAGLRPQVYVVGLHVRNDAEAILRAMRAGSSEFLYAPFDPEIQFEAIGRIARSKRPAPAEEAHRGRLIAFSSTKPGSGASTLASQTAFMLSQSSGKRTLLADFDLWSGTVGFFFRLNHWYSLLDVLEQAGRVEDVDWASVVVSAQGIDVLPAPETPREAPVEPERLHDVLDYLRTLYDWVLVDLPSVFDRMSLLTLSSCDDAFLVCTPELPSLHLTRKAVGYLGQMGFGRERYRVLVNRLGKQEGITVEDMAKIFTAPVYRTFPNDYLSLHKGLTVGQPLGSRSQLGRAIEEFTSGLLAFDAALHDQKRSKTGTRGE